MEVVQTDLAPSAIGTYSQAIRHQDTIYLSGQIPLDPKTMSLCSEDIHLQVKQVLDNLSAVAEAAGGSLDHVVKVTVYLIDLLNASVVNEAMANYFHAPYPARVMVGVSALPKGAQVEIDAIMILPA